MLTRALRWLALRLIMATQNRPADYIHRNGSVEGALPYYLEWTLWEIAGYRLALTHLITSPYKPLEGRKLVLLGWYRAYVQEKPRHVVLRDVGSFSGRPERAELPERGNCWLIRWRKA